MSNALAAASRTEKVSSMQWRYTKCMHKYSKQHDVIDGGWSLIQRNQSVVTHPLSHPGQIARYQPHLANLGEFQRVWVGKIASQGLFSRIFPPKCAFHAFLSAETPPVLTTHPFDQGACKIALIWCLSGITPAWMPHITVFPSSPFCQSLI